MSVVSGQFLPTRPPIITGTVLWLLLDRIDPGPIACAVTWTLFGVFALCCVVLWCVEVFGDKLREPQWRAKP